MTSDLLIALFDGGRARFVRMAADNALHTTSNFLSPTIHAQSADLGSDRPGASYHTGSTAHHALNPAHDLHDREKQRFAHSVASELNAAVAAGGVSSLVLVAPPHPLGELIRQLSPAAEALIVGLLHKDLSKVPDHELWPHLRRWVAPVRRDRSVLDADPRTNACTLKDTLHGR